MKYGRKSPPDGEYTPALLKEREQMNLTPTPLMIITRPSFLLKPHPPLLLSGILVDATDVDATRKTSGHCYRTSLFKSDQSPF